MSTKKNYWTPEHQEIIKSYFYSQYDSNSGFTRNQCVKNLLPVLQRISKDNMNQLRTPLTDDNMQECLIKITTHILPRLKEDLLQAAEDFIWIGTRNFLINKHATNHINYDTMDELNYGLVADEGYEADHTQDVNDTYIDILNEIDRKIIEQKVINKTSSIFLILMKEYLALNSMDPRGFNVWVMDKMNIKKSTYCSLMSRCKIKSKPFNEKLIKN
jgi:hypothetical protein